jgi:hypothetical protein
MQTDGQVVAIPQVGGFHIGTNAAPRNAPRALVAIATCPLKRPRLVCRSRTNPPVPFKSPPGAPHLQPANEIRHYRELGLGDLNDANELFSRDSATKPI